MNISLICPAAEASPPSGKTSNYSRTQGVPLLPPLAKS